MVPTTIPSYYQYWGKARKNDDNSHDFHLLPYHCLDVAAVGYTFLTSNAHMKERLSHILSCKPEQTIQFIAFFLAIHDLGKYSESFQKLVPEVWEQLGGTDNRKSSVNLRHDSLGYLLWDSGVWQDSISHEFLEIMGGEDADIWQYLLSPCARAVFAPLS